MSKKRPHTASTLLSETSPREEKKQQPKNPRHQRTAAERQAQLVEIARRVREGEPQEQIAQSLGLSRQQIGYDMKDVLKRWREEATREVAAHIAVLVQQIDLAYRQAFEGWLRSVQPRKRLAATVKEQEGKNGSAGGGKNTEKRTSQEERDGTPEFLNVMLRCLDQKAKLLGANKPTNGTIGHFDLETLTNEQLDRYIAGESLESILRHPGNNVAGTSKSGRRKATS